MQLLALLETPSIYCIESRAGYRLNKQKTNNVEKTFAFRYERVVLKNTDCCCL
jgi:hypothetical protein